MSKFYVFITRTIGDKGASADHFRFLESNVATTYYMPKISSKGKTSLNKKVKHFCADYVFIKEILSENSFIDAECKLLPEKDIVKYDELENLDNLIKLIFCFASFLDTKDIEYINKSSTGWEDKDSFIAGITQKITERGKDVNSILREYCEGNSQNGNSGIDIYKDTTNVNFFAIKDNDKGYKYSDSSQVKAELEAICRVIGSKMDNTYFFLHTSLYKDFLKNQRESNKNDKKSEYYIGFHHTYDSPVYKFLSMSYDHVRFEKYAEDIFVANDILNKIDEEKWDEIKNNSNILVEIIDSNFRGEYKELKSILELSDTEFESDSLVEHIKDLIELKYRYKALLR